MRQRLLHVAAVVVLALALGFPGASTGATSLRVLPWTPNAVVFVRTDRKRARICPACGDRVAGTHRLGAYCGACGSRLHGWLVALYEDRGAA